VSADTLVPGAGNPQALNRYAYVYNSPLKYVDPSGHDVMIVGGRGSNVYDNPAAFEMWVRAYKGWDATQWANFYDAWMNGSRAVRTQLMNTNGVHFFDYDMSDNTSVDDKMINELSRQMVGMHDIILVGYSKGANLVMNYIASQERDGGPDLTYVGKAVPIKPAFSWASMEMSNTGEPGGQFSRSRECVGDNFVCYDKRSYSGGPQLVNIHGTFDTFTFGGPIAGTFNIVDDSQMENYQLSQHGHATGKAIQAFAALDVGGDRNSGLYRYVPWSGK
jgi:hypothetical protein